MILGYFRDVLLFLALLPSTTVGLNLTFEDGSIPDKLVYVQYTRVLGVDAPVVGAGSLEIDTRASENEWNQCVYTQAGLLQPDTDYVITVDYHVLEQNSKNSYLLFLVRPVSIYSHVSDLTTRTLEASTVKQRRQIRFHVPKGVTDYAFQIHTHNKVLALVYSVSIEKAGGLTFHPAAENFGKRIPESRPTGAKDFKVFAPRPGGGIEVSVKDFKMTEDSPDNTAALQEAIKHCREVHASRLVVPKGVYRFTSDQTVLFEGLKDFVFDGNGSKFVFHKKHNHLFQISNCERVEFKDFEVDWDWDVDPLGSVVKVENVNPLDGSVDLLFLDYKEFPRYDIRIRKMEELDRATMAVGCEGCADIYFEFKYGADQKNPTRWLSGNQLRLFATEQGQIEKFKSNVTVGKLFRVRHYIYDMHGLVLNGNAHLTLRNIDIYSCPGHALLSYGEQHHWQFIEVNIKRPPANNLHSGSPPYCPIPGFFSHGIL